VTSDLKEGELLYSLDRGDPIIPVGLVRPAIAGLIANEDEEIVGLVGLLLLLLILLLLIIWGFALL
jgi:hypothetical protein